MKTIPARDLKIGDFFIERFYPYEAYEVVGWYKDGDCPRGRRSDGFETLFAGCSEPYGPFKTCEEAARRRPFLLKQTKASV